MSLLLLAAACGEELPVSASGERLRFHGQEAPIFGSNPRLPERMS
jgi:hypothetical protein